MNRKPSSSSLQIATNRLDAVVSQVSTLEKRRTSILAGDYVPETFEDMFSHYYDFVVKLVATFGIDFQNSEDVAMTILTKFFEKDVLSDFDPEFTTQYDGVTRKAVFRTFLSGFVRTYVRHYADRQKLHKIREGFSVDTPLFIFADSGEPMTWMDYVGPRYHEEYDELHGAELVRSIRKRLERIQPRNAQDQCDMPKFFDSVLQQVFDHGRVDASALAGEFGVSKTSVQNWLKRLRSEVSIVVKAY